MLQTAFASPRATAAAHPPAWGVAALAPVASRKLSCGVVILNDRAELLLCHVTGHEHWDLPKGGAQAEEGPLAAALRETREETGLALDPADLLDLGRLSYRPRKDLHLFATRLPRLDTRLLRCESRFDDAGSGLRLPEMDGYGWFAFEHVRQVTTRKLATVLTEQVDLPGTLRRLQALALVCA